MNDQQAQAEQEYAYHALYEAFNYVYGTDLPFDTFTAVMDATYTMINIAYKQGRVSGSKNMADVIEKTLDGKPF